MWARLARPGEPLADRIDAAVAIRNAVADLEGTTEWEREAKEAAVRVLRSAWGLTPSRRSRRVLTQLHLASAGDEQVVGIEQHAHVHGCEGPGLEAPPAIAQSDQDVP